MNPAVTLEDVTLGYERHPAVHHIRGSFMRGSLTAVTGPNGAGKSTLLKGIAGILKPDEGRILYDGNLKHDMAYLPQAIELRHDFPLTVSQMIATGFWRRSGNFGAIGKKQREQISGALQTTGLRGFEDRQVSTLSAGQFQRTLFARLLLQDAQLILLDEPFAAVDVETASRLISIVQKWHGEGRTLICVVHDMAQIQESFPECLLLARECIAWGTTKDTLKPELLAGSRMFREAWEMDGRVCAQ